MKVEFYKHNISSSDIALLDKVLNSLYLTTGQYTRQFENKLANYLNCKEVVGVNSCTAALHISLVVLGIGTGDEVITTPLSFYATSNAILYTGAKPVFVDVEKTTGQIDANLIVKAITKKTKAILPVHMYGQMCNMAAIYKIAKRYKLKVVEDAALCLEGRRDGFGPASLSDAACFSFHAIKSITSGEGGAIAVNNVNLAKKLKLLRLHGMGKSVIERKNDKLKKQDMKVFGYKCNMYDLQAALLIRQMDKLNKFLNLRNKLDQTYRQAFKNNKKISLPVLLANSKSASTLFNIFVDPKKRDEYLIKLQAAGIGADVKYRPIHLSTYYKKVFHYKPGSFPIAENISASSITLPLYPKLKPAEINYIIKIVNKLIK